MSGTTISQLMQTRFAPVGRCIYCGSTSSQLGDEHIIAYGLNGNAVLPEASCRACEKVTSQIEKSFLRGVAWPMRARFGFQTRRPKKIPDSFAVYVMKKGVKRKLMVPLANYPLVLPLPIFPLPAFCEGRIVNGIEVRGVVCISLVEGIPPSEVIENARKNLGVDGLELPQFEAFSFGRMVLKSAYALTVAEHGLNKIREPLAAPVILGHRHELGTLLGSTPGVSASENAQHITDVSLFRRGDEAIAVASVKVLGTLPAPIYVAVTARMNAEQSATKSLIDAVR